jgi:hypothetical protein
LLRLRPLDEAGFEHDWAAVRHVLRITLGHAAELDPQQWSARALQDVQNHQDALRCKWTPGQLRIKAMSNSKYCAVKSQETGLHVNTPARFRQSLGMFMTDVERDGARIDALVVRAIAELDTSIRRTFRADFSTYFPDF